MLNVFLIEVYTGWVNKMLPLLDYTQVFEMRAYSKILFTDKEASN